MAYDAQRENKQRAELCGPILSMILEKYKSEDVSENERIIDYHMTGYGFADTFDETSTEFNMYVSYMVTPYSENSTKWKGEDYNYISFATIKRVDDELVIESVREEPEYIDEFMEKYEEYLENNNSIETETSSIQGEDVNLESSTTINNIRYTVIGVFLIVFIVCSIVLFKTYKK